MQLARTLRRFSLALAFSLIPVSAFAGVSISVNIAPPPLPVYEQPPCPQEGYLWTPGYWAYGDDGYYWVPGTWVPAPHPGLLWTPGYWGWSGGAYLFHEGYWGPHVGYYGGVNYGFGFGGIGFAGGEWRGGHFAYNTAVMRVNRSMVHNTYENTTIINRTTIINNNHTAYSGGPGGIRHEPLPEERFAEREHHAAPSSFQQQHIQAARTDRNSYVRNNGGRPANVAVSRPLNNSGAHGNEAMRPQEHNAPHNDIRQQSHNDFSQRNANQHSEQQMQHGQQPQQFHSEPQNRHEEQNRHQEQQQQHQQRDQQQRDQQQSHHEQQSRPAPQSRPEPQHNAPAPQHPAEGGRHEDGNGKHK